MTSRSLQEDCGRIHWRRENKLRRGAFLLITGEGGCGFVIRDAEGMWFRTSRTHIDWQPQEE